MKRYLQTRWIVATLEENHCDLARTVREEKGGENSTLLFTFRFAGGGASELYFSVVCIMRQALFQQWRGGFLIRACQSFAFMDGNDGP